MLILRTAVLCGCNYQWAHHVRTGRAAGITEAEIDQLREGSAHPSWTPRDVTIVRSAEQLVTEHQVDDDTWAELAQVFPDDQVMELMMLVGHYVMIAGLVNSIGVDLDPDLQ